MQLLEYLDEAGRSPFAQWFDALNPQAAAKVTIALARLGGRQCLERQGCWGRRARMQD
jgi:hypothetical protein